MRFILALVSGAALLAAGCNSKPSPSAATEEPVATAEPENQATPVFRSRSASLSGPTPTNAVADFKARTSRAGKRSPFPPTAIQSTPGRADLVEEQPEAAEGSAEDAVAENVRPEDPPQEGDEILIPPRMLGKLIPGANFDAVEREEPINVKSLLEQRGIVLTNYQQL